MEIPDFRTLLTDPNYGAVANMAFYVISFMAIAAAMVHLSAGLAGRSWSEKKKQGIMKSALIFGLILGLSMSGIAKIQYITFFSTILQWVLLISIPFVLFFLKSLFFVATKLITHEGSQLWAWLLAILGSLAWIYAGPKEIQRVLQKQQMSLFHNILPVIFVITIVGAIVIIFGNLMGVASITKHFKPEKKEKAAEPEATPEAEPEPEAAAPAATSKEVAEINDMDRLADSALGEIDKAISAASEVGK